MLSRTDGATTAPFSVLDTRPVDTANPSPALICGKPPVAMPLNHAICARSANSDMSTGARLEPSSGKRSPSAGARPSAGLLAVTVATVRGFHCLSPMLNVVDVDVSLPADSHSAELVQQGGGLFDDKRTPTDVNLFLYISPTP